MFNSSWQDRFRMIASVYLMLSNERGEVLLLRRRNTGFKDGELGLPAGHADGGEPLALAMRREAREEVGIDIQPEALTLAHAMHRNCGDHERLDFFFIANRWVGEVVNAEPDKCEQLLWAPLDNLPKDVIDYYVQAFDCVRDGKAYSAFGW